MFMPRPLIPCANAATVADLKRGDTAALFPHSTDMCEIVHVEPHRHGDVWVTYQWAPGGPLKRFLMPGGNVVQIAWRD